MRARVDGFLLSTPGPFSLLPPFSASKTAFAAEALDVAPLKAELATARRVTLPCTRFIFMLSSAVVKGTTPPVRREPETEPLVGVFFNPPGGTNLGAEGKIRQRADSNYVEPGSLTLWWYGEWI